MKASRHLVIKTLLLVIGMMLVLTYAFYTQHLVNRLRVEGQQNLRLLVENYKFKVMHEASSALETGRTINFPLILTSSDGTPKFWKNVGIASTDRTPENMEELRRLAVLMDSQERPPIAIDYNGVQDVFHYGDSPLIRQMQYYPYIALLGIGLFILIGYISFTYLKRSEETQVWVGMAKETAHQLGTPLSSLMGWVELMKTTPPGEESIIAMQYDLERLEKVVARFSKIGSAVDLKEQDLIPVVRRVADYFRQRLPMQSRSVTLEESYPADPVNLRINAFLIEWVVENLLKNSLDSIHDTTGEIQVTVALDESNRRVLVEVRDSGCGVDPGLRKQIFRPGFSTRKRGWGLGLSLARRIVENYHGGRIFVKDSKVGTGTTMRLYLPLRIGKSQ
jgi:signal transduction histidine kinase